MHQLSCKICASEDIEALGSKYGSYAQRDFHVYRCKVCAYAFVADAWLDYPAIYSEAYYKGCGADPLVDYVFELENPTRTIRQYEWRGILQNIASLTALSSGTRWLDFGCGNGGLVRYVREKTKSAAFGYEHGWIKERAAKAQIPLLSDADMEAAQGSFDVVTAIEVLEHVPDPIAELCKIRSMLKAGGLFFYTTGNARPQRDRLLLWSYLVPEIHISFYEPQTFALALHKTGFRTELTEFLPGFTDIIRFKMLKNFRLREPTLWQRALPWPLLSRIVDKRFHVTAHPIAWAE